MSNPSFFSFGKRLLVSTFFIAALSEAATPTAGFEVAVFKLSAQSLATQFELDAVVEPVKKSSIAAQISGRVASLEVRAGDQVQVGQLLLTIDDREVKNAVQRSQAQLAQAEAELRNATIHFERTKQLKREGFMSQAALDTAETQYKAVLAGRAQAQAGLEHALLSQEYSRVTAPYSGYVFETAVHAGDLAVPGRPLLLMYAPTPLRAVVQVPITLSKGAQNNSRAEVQLPDAQGALHWVAPSSQQILSSADQIAQTIEWRLDLSPSDQQQLVPGQQLRARFVGAQATRMMVPATSILRRGELTAVYVVGGPGFVLKAVRVGQDYGAAGIEILAGLSTQEQIAVDPVKAGLLGAHPPHENKPSATSSFKQ
ncbi:MAG: efflux RND transporter periplasmic adaptor subunit [Alcaligenaceae bacterium]